MANIHFERKISKYELDNRCLLLEDDNGQDFSTHFKTEHLHIRSAGKTYRGLDHVFYVGKKFLKGIAFLKDLNPDQDFFFDQSISGGKRFKLDTDPDVQENGAQVINIEVFVVTVRK